MAGELMVDGSSFAISFRFPFYFSLQPLAFLPLVGFGRIGPTLWLAFSFRLRFAFTFIVRHSPFVIRHSSTGFPTCWLAGRFSPASWRWKAPGTRRLEKLRYANGDIQAQKCLHASISA